MHPAFGKCSYVRLAVLSTLFMGYGRSDVYPLIDRTDPMAHMRINRLIVAVFMD